MKREWQDADKVGELHCFLGFCVCCTFPYEKLKMKSMWEKSGGNIPHHLTLCPWETGSQAKTCVHCSEVKPWSFPEVELAQGDTNCSALTMKASGAPAGTVLKVTCCQGTGTLQTSPCAPPAHYIDQWVDCELFLESKQNLGQSPERNSWSQGSKLSAAEVTKSSVLRRNLGSRPRHPSHPPFPHP